MTICSLEGEAVAKEWDSFVEGASAATISHLYAWRRIVSEAYNHKTFYLAAWREGALTGILPLVYIRSRLFGNALVSMPFQDYGGIVARDEEAFRSLLAQALQLQNNCRAQYLDFRYRMAPLVPKGVPYGDKSTLILDISAGTESLWKSFSPKVRNQVRKAQKAGLCTQIGGTELLEDFYHPFAANMRDLGSPVHHPEFFHKIFSVFHNNSRVVLVRDGNQTVGGLIAFFHKNTVTVPWASCYRNYFSKCPNNLLYWDALQYACERGIALFDFGRSSLASGTYRFKLQWGAKPYRLHWHRFSTTTVPPATESQSLKLASVVWKYLPVTLANIIGPRVRRFITN